MIRGDSSRTEAMRTNSSVTRRQVSVVQPGCRRNVGAFLGLFLVLVVSGEDAPVSIYGLTAESVLLPCNCSEMEKPEFFWQKEKDNEKHSQPILGYTNVSYISKNYTGRVKIFQHVNMNNCSLHLENITVEDQGTYRCSYMASGYHGLFVHLIVFENHYRHPPITTSGGKTLFKCDFFSRDENALVLWHSDGVVLNSSLENNITTNKIIAAFTGIHVFNSTLTTTHSNWTSEPQCFHHDTPVLSELLPPPQLPHPSRRVGIVCVVLFVLTLGLSLLLFRHWKRSREKKRYQRAHSSISSGDG